MRSMHQGGLTIDRDFSGMLRGTATVPAGATVEISGMIHGALVAEEGADVTVSGMIHGPIDNRGGTVRVTGMVTG